MSGSWLQFFKEALGAETKLHPLEHRMAKRHIKQRLAVVWPELRGNSAALEQAYQALNLEPRAGRNAEEAATVFEVTLPAGKN